MSECPDCDETGFTLEGHDERDDEPVTAAREYRIKCRNWRHSFDHEALKKKDEHHG